MSFLEAGTRNSPDSSFGSSAASSTIDVDSVAFILKAKKSLLVKLGSKLELCVYPG